MGGVCPTITHQMTNDFVLRDRCHLLPTHHTEEKAKGSCPGPAASSHRLCGAWQRNFEDTALSILLMLLSNQLRLLYILVSFARLSRPRAPPPPPPPHILPQEKSQWLLAALYGGTACFFVEAASLPTTYQENILSSSTRSIIPALF